jgi:hypothetical protein
MLLKHLPQFCNLGQERIAILRGVSEFTQESPGLLVVIACAADQIRRLRVLLQYWKEMLFLEVRQKLQFLAQRCKQLFAEFDGLMGGVEESGKEFVGLIGRGLADGSVGGHNSSQNGGSDPDDQRRGGWLR